MRAFITPELLNKRNVEGNTLIYEAVLARQKEFIEALLSFPYLDVNARCSNGNTLLHLVTEHSNSELMKVFIERGARLDIKNDAKKTVFHLASPEFL